MELNSCEFVRCSSYKLVFENKDFIIINKLEAANYHSEGGLFERVKKLHPQIISVHRLDKETTGLIIFAKSKSIARDFQKLFESRKIIKFYLALSDMKPRKKQGKITGDMKKSRGGSYKLLKSTVNPAITQFFSYILLSGIRGYLLKPCTGKTHQLRVFMKSLGSPIIGDSRYGGTVSSRMYLHAYYLSFRLNEKDFEFSAKDVSGKLFESFFTSGHLDDLGGISWPKF